MRLRNKQTGEIVDLDYVGNLKAQFGGISVIPDTAKLGGDEYVYHSLEALTEEWEDYEEPKVGYIIDPMEEDCVSADNSGYEESDIERAKELGIWFETEEDAKRAVKKLKAFRRLEDKGFRFNGWTIDDGLRISICTNMDGDGIYDDNKKEMKSLLDLVFGGEE